MKKFSKQVSIFFNNARNKENNKGWVSPESVVLEALNDEEVAEAFANGGGDVETAKEVLAETIEKQTSIMAPNESKTRMTSQLESIVRNFDENEEVDVKTFFEAISKLPSSCAASVINSAPELFEELDNQISKSYSNNSSAEPSKEFLRFAKELTSKEEVDKFLPLIGRDMEIDRIQCVLLRKSKNNPIIIGEAGVGKTAIVEGLAQRIYNNKVPKKMRGKKIFSVDITGMLAGSNFRGDFEKRIKLVVDEAIEKQYYLFIDEFHTVMGAGSASNEGGASDASQIIKPALARGELHLIGATTFDDFKIIERDKAFCRRVQKVVCLEPTIEEAKHILVNIAPAFEKHHKVKYTDEAINVAVDASAKYITDQFLPDKAIDLLDEAGSRVSLDGRNSVDKGDIVALCEKVTGVKCVLDSEDITVNTAIKNLEEKLKNRVFGQDEAVTSITKRIKLSESGLGDDNKPVANALFVGSTGIGKTELAKALSEELNYPLLRFDMSEYMEKHSVSKLIGSPAGYVGYEDGGALVDQIRKNPKSILLLDEIEKAHPDIFNILLQIMDNATLTDNKGNKADFRNVVLIMTSNCGVEEATNGKATIGFGKVSEKEAVNSKIIGAVERTFKPEFRNRLTNIIVFNPIDKEIGRRIAERELGKLVKKLETKKITTTYDESVINKIVEDGVSIKFGAREIQRIVDEIREMLVDAIIDEKINDKVNIAIKDNKFSIA